MLIGVYLLVFLYHFCVSKILYTFLYVDLATCFIGHLLFKDSLNINSVSKGVTVYYLPKVTIRKEGISSFQQQLVWAISN